MSNTLSNVPVRLISKEDLQVGDVLVFRSLEELTYLEKEGLLHYGWNTSMNVLLNNEYVVTEEIINYPGEKIAVHNINGWNFHVGTSMLRLKHKDWQDGQEEEAVTEEILLKPTIRQREKDPAVLLEMKKMVDKKRLKTLLSISSTHSGEVHIVSDSMVDKYLDLWANAKYEYFLLFGKQLRTEKEVEVDVNDETIRILCADLAKEFPVYGYIIEQFNASEFRSNEIKYNHDVKRFANDTYKIGMKLSKFFSSFLNDPKFDIAVSKIMQNKKAVHKIYASIDPYDYLTMSLNQHNWDSCHRITDGCYGTGPLSYMLDDATLIAYRENGNEFSYNYFNLKFKGNSKSWRQCIYFDKDSCSMIFGRQYPNMIDDITKAIRIHMEDITAEAINAPNNIWTVFNNRIDGTYEDATNLHYSDVEEGYDYKFVKLKHSNVEAEFYVGYEAPCLICGDEGGMNNGAMGVCEECLDEMGYDED